MSIFKLYENDIKISSSENKNIMFNDLINAYCNRLYIFKKNNIAFNNVNINIIVKEMQKKKKTIYSNILNIYKFNFALKKITDLFHNEYYVNIINNTYLFINNNDIAINYFICNNILSYMFNLDDNKNELKQEQKKNIININADQKNDIEKIDSNMINENKNDDKKNNENNDNELLINANNSILMEKNNNALLINSYISDKQSYELLKKDIDNGILIEKDINPLYKKKYKIFTFMKDNNLLNQCIYAENVILSEFEFYKDMLKISNNLKDEDIDNINNNMFIEMINDNVNVEHQQKKNNNVI